MAFKFDDSYIGAARAFGKKAREAKAAGDNDQAQAMMANKASSAIGGALTAVNGVTGILNTALQSANIQDTSQYEGQIDLLSQAGNRNYYDYGQLTEDMSNTDFSVNTDYDAIRGMGGKGVTKEKIGAVGSSTLNGAMTGLQVGGPWGAAIGAVVGAGSAIGGILAGDQKARIQQGFLDANADRATTDAMLNFNAGLEEIGNRRNRFNLANYAAKGGKIEIKKENEGKFTAAAKRHNMTVQEFAKHVLAKKNADKYSATMRKRANFARNAAGWKHAEGGYNKKQKLIDRINSTSQADFVKRLQDRDRKYIDYGDSIATHRMAYVTDADDRAIVYPEVQSVGDSLHWFTGQEAIDRAIKNKDTLMMSIPEAEWFTTHYKKYYPKGNTFDDGGPIDYSGIATTNNRPYNTDYISYIDTALRNGGLNDYQRAAVLANIIEESGGNPFAEGPGGFYGLLQWSGARYPKTQEKDIYKEIDNQVANILSTAKNSTDKMSWTHGGKGSGYNSLTDAMKAYNGENLADVMKGYTLGYVRPAAGINAYNNRLKVAEQLYNLKGFTQHAEGGELNTSKMNTYNTHGGYFNPGLISIDAGGTHEQNPNGGVQLGVDSQGIPNFVEEGETVYDDYVFSDRLKPSASELKKFNLPDKFVGKTFAELSDVLGEEAKERPNDAISNSGLGVMLDRLIACQEVHKQAQEERELMRELNKLSPEELVALGSQLQQMSDQPAMAQQGMQQYMPQMEAPMIQPMPIDDQSPMIAEQQPMMAAGGLLHVYKDGGVKETVKKVYNKAKDIDKKLHLGMLSTPTVTLPDGTEVDVNTGGGVAELLMPPVSGASALKQLKQLTRESKKTGKLIKEGLAFLKEQEESQKKATEIMKVLGEAEDAARTSGVKYESASQAAIKAKEKVNSLIKAGDYRQAAVEHEKYTKALEKLGTATEADLSAQSALLKAQSNADKVRSIKNIEPVVDATGQLSLFDNAATYTMREPTRVAGKHPWGLTAGILGGIGAAGAGAVGALLQRNNESDVPTTVSLPAGSGVLYEDTDPTYATGGHLYPWGSWLFPRKRINYGGTSDIWPNTRATNPSVDVGQTGYGVVYAPTSGDRVIKNAYLPNAAVGNYSGYAIPSPEIGPEVTNEQVRNALGYSSQPIPPLGHGVLLREYTDNYIDSTGSLEDQKLASTPVILNKPSTSASVPASLHRAIATAGVTGTAGNSQSAGRSSLGLPNVEPITSEAVDTLARLRRRGSGLEALPGIQVGGAVAASGAQPGETPSIVDLAGVQSGDTNARNSTPLLPTMGRYAGTAGNALSALDIALQSPDRVSWNRIQPNYVAGNLDLQKMRYTPIDWQIGANQVNANAAATRRAISNTGMGPAVGATLLAANYGNNQNLGNVINQTQLANDQRRAQTIGVNNQAENLMRNFDFRRNAMNTQIANQFAQYNNQLDMDETLRNIQFENDKYAALSHAISNSLNDISNIGRENFAMNQINSNAALYYGVGANGWAYYKGYDGVDWKVDPQSGRRVPVTDKSEIPAAQQKHGGMLKKYKGC